MKAIKLSHILSDIKKYCKMFSKISHLIPKPSCKDENCKVIGWGTRKRKKVKKSSRKETRGVPLKRFYCKICEKTLFFLPSFLIFRKRYEAETINESLEKFSEGEGISKICNDLCIFEQSTVKRWLYPIKENFLSIKQEAHKFACKITYHFREEQMIEKTENFKRNSIYSLFAFLKGLSSFLEGLGFIKRTPYHYALLFNSS